MFKATGKEDAHRPDISILYPLNLPLNVDSEEFTDKLLNDLSVTNPLSVTVVSDLQPTLSDALTPGTATNNPLKLQKIK